MAVLPLSTEVSMQSSSGCEKSVFMVVFIWGKEMALSLLLEAIVVVRGVSMGLSRDKMNECDYCS